jgi:Icc-related predicted phosphoesterase
MKLYVTSDIHLEFGDLDLKNDDNVDVLILSGDICVAADIGRPDPNNHVEGARSARVRDFFLRCSDRFPHSIYVMGNHEHYHGDFAKTQKILQNMLDQAGISNIYLLEKSTVEIGGYLFIGGCLWTDFNGQDPLTLMHAEHYMNDYRGVKNTSDTRVWKFLPKHSLKDHQQMVGYIKTVLDNRRAQDKRDKNVVVVGHHCPSRSSTHPRYANETLTNGLYSTNLDELIMDYPEIQVWTHGHTHEDFDYMIGTTRIVCNPRGYINYESRAFDWKPKLIELE